MMRGDRVRKRNGNTFGNREHVVTVDRIEQSGNLTKVWFQETGTWSSKRDLIIESKALVAEEL